MKACIVPPAVLAAMLTAESTLRAQPAPEPSGAYAALLLADAAGRAGVQAAKNTGFTVNVHGYLQHRYYLNARDEPPAGEENLTNGFQLRRARITVEGDLADGWGYKVQGNFSRSTGLFELVDGYGTYKADDNWTITFGQFKLPFAREQLIGATAQLAVERSITNGTFLVNYSQGVQAAYQTDDWRLACAFSDGANTENKDFTAASEADYSLTARAEWKWAGDWKQFRDFTSFRDSPRAGLLGASLHWQSGGETSGTADVDTFSATTDVSLEGNGWNAFAAAFYRSTDAGGVGELDDLGFLAQAGCFLDDSAEVFARYDVAIPDDDRAGTADPFSTLTFGLNYYITPHSHAAKLTADVVWFLDSSSDTGGLVAPSSGLGLLPDAGEDQAALRLQMQVVF